MEETQEKSNGESVMSESEATLAEIGITTELPARLSQEDFALFKPALNNLRDATSELQQAQNQLARAQCREIAVKGALIYVVGHLRTKYAMQDGDDIDEDGVIIRKA